MYLQVNESVLLLKQNCKKSEKSTSLLNFFNMCVLSDPLWPSLCLGLRGRAFTGHRAGAERQVSKNSTVVGRCTDLGDETRER